MRKPSLLKRKKKDTAKSAEAAPGKPQTLPGPSSDPSTNLMIADVVIRSISSIARETAKKSMARKRFDRDEADRLTARGSIGKTLLLYGAAKVASRSLPGAVFVGGALLAKSALDRKASKAPEEQPKRIKSRLGEHHQAILLDEDK